MRRALVVVIALCVLGPVGADAAPKPARLGTDPSGDGAPSLDLTYLDVLREGRDLEIRFGLSGMLPVTGGIPELPGIEWIFTSGGRTWVAEVVPGNPGRYFLFEYDGTTFHQAPVTPTGGFLFDEGYAFIRIPLKAIGAKKGSIVAGSDALGENDVDAHVHHPAGTDYPDYMKTDKGFKIR